MFTGIVQAMGTVVSLNVMGTDRRISISSPMLEEGDLGVGHSIAVSGVCLTLTSLTKDSFAADVSAETLSRTILAISSSVQP